jgi:hypothetical protein
MRYGRPCIAPQNGRRYNFFVRGQDPGKARRRRQEEPMWPRLVERPPPWRRAEWWERQRRREALAVLVPALRLAIRVVVRVVTQW